MERMERRVGFRVGNFSPPRDKLGRKKMSKPINEMIWYEMAGMDE